MRNSNIINAEYYKKIDSNIKCELCPNYCLIHPGKKGICKVRGNVNGEIDLPFCSKITSLAVDPIEKKPLFHFYPGKEILSAGFIGCSFKCPFCQNYTISQMENTYTDFILPEELIKIALRKKSFAIAYTYSEPLIHYEYIKKCSKLAKNAGIKNVIVTNGQINRKPAEELLEHIDASNIDLKSFNEKFYLKELGGNLEAVKDFIKLAHQKCFIEVTTLVIPGKNDSDKEMENISEFIANISPDIPFHLSCYHPAFKYKIPSTTVESINRLKKIASKYLKWVFPGNAIGVDYNSYCHECGHLLIKRSGYSTEISGIKNGKCLKCKNKLPIIGI